jgi:3-phytase
VGTQSELESARTKVWGDYSAMCGWRAPSGAQYLYVFGKKVVKVYLLRDDNDRVNVLEVCRSHLYLKFIKTNSSSVQVFTAPVPIEAEGCTVSQGTGAVIFASGDGNVYAFRAAESTERPSVQVLFSTNEEVSGLTTYYGLHEEYLLVVFADHINIYDAKYTLVKQVGIAGVGDYELNDVAIYQGVIGPMFPSGAIAYAIESDELTGFGISSLESVFSNLDPTSTFAPNTVFTPREFVSDNSTAPTCESLDNCSGSGFCPSRARTLLPIWDVPMLRWVHRRKLRRVYLRKQLQWPWRMRRAQYLRLRGRLGWSHMCLPSGLSEV